MLTSGPIDVKPIKNPEIKYTGLFINNEFVKANSGKTFPVYNPSVHDMKIADVQEGDASDIDKAVKAAEAAFDRSSTWRQMDASARGELLYKLGDLLVRDVNYLASLESFNNGKPYANAHGEVLASAAAMKFYAGAADKVAGQVIPADGMKFAHTSYEPIGVCGAITPWNYPVLMAAIKIAPCLAMGNTLVLKPAEQTPLTTLAIAALVKEAGFPAGVLNVVPGFGPSAGQPLCEHPTVRKITFTGSTVIGKLIQQVSSKNVKRVSLELGGKSPLIIFPDCDMDKAVQTAHDMVFINQGQCCVAATRTFVHESIYDEFVKRAVELAKKRKVGNPLELDVQQGPQIDCEQFEKILDLIDSGKKEGAKLECGGKRIGDKGLFVEPTVFSQVTDDMRIAKEEIFGPVQQILKFKDTDEVIKRANATDYGLGAGLFTKDLDRAMYVSHRLNAGQVYVNNYFNTSIQIPFGGFKESGIGREFGLDGLRQYYEIKSIIYDLPFKV